MAHKTLIGGTAYDVTGGRTLIGGTGYDITSGRTLVGGTGYDISFGGDPIAAFLGLMDVASFGVKSGRNSTSTGSISITTPASDVYIFAFCDGAWSVTRNGTNIYHSHAEKAWVYTTASLTYLSNNGGVSTTNVYGGTLISFTFPGYTTSQADAIIANLSTLDSVGSNTSTSDTMGLSVAQTGTVMVAYNAHFAMSSPIGTLVYSTYTNNPSMLWYDSGTAYFSTNGTSASSVRTCSIISLG